MAYKSKHKGEDIDNAVDKIKAIGDKDIATTEELASAIQKAIVTTLNTPV